MDESKEIVERLRGLELVGGSHQMLAAIGAAVLPTHHGWTSGACRALRDRLVELVEDDGGASLSERNLAYDLGYDAGFASADDWLGQNEGAMGEHGWVRLPLDADGEPVRVGDWVRDLNEAEPYGVTELRLDKHGWTALSDDGDRYVPTQCRHYKPDSWERVERDARATETWTSPEVERIIARCRALAGES